MNGLELNLRANRCQQPQYLVRLADGVIEEANDAFLQLFGYQSEQLGSLQEAQVFEKTCLIGADIEADHWVKCLTLSGQSFVMEKRALELCRGNDLYSVVTLSETAMQEKVLNRMRLSEQIFATALDGIIVTDNQGIIQYVNPAFIQITGYAAEELFGMSPRILNSGRHDEEFYRQMWDKLANEGQWNGEVWNRRKNGETYPEWLAISSIRDPQGNILMYTAMFRDLSERYQYEQRIKHQALHDPLTGLPNRRFFNEKLSTAIAGAHQLTRQFVLIYLDLDGFKQVNDSLGHDAGDQVLRVTAERLLHCVGDHGDCFRMGGDEFAVLLQEGESNLTSAAQAIAGCILTDVRQPIGFAEQTASVGASIGIAIFPTDGQDAESILVAADSRMYVAKRGGRNRIVSAGN
jgi:diguanylate cyclase (GGDEF)-like protein/PAS domain S-box-containing protein